MSLKENLLKKIQINALAKKVISSFGPPDSGMKIDKEAMRNLLEMSPYEPQKKRDLELYVTSGDGEKKKILVLDNELPIYLTTIEDVALRKSPYIKEMVSIRNMIKILKDSDVKISIKGESVKSVQKECLDLLDLSYSNADIEKIARDGAASLDSGYAAGVNESLILFAELLGYQPPPKAFGIRHHEIHGALLDKEVGEIMYGPIVLHSLIDNTLKLISAPISSFDKKKMEFYRQVAQGNEKADAEGAGVFEYLKNAMLNR